MPMAKLFIIAGIILVTAGVILTYASKPLSFLGRLPGDIRIERDGFRFYFPFTSSVLVSFVVSLIIGLIRR